MTIHEAERFQLGSYWFDPAARLLLRNGDEIPLSRKAGDLLALLLTNLGKLVLRETIFEQVWPEGFVSEGNLTQTIYLLRKAFAADPAVLIENVPRRGYRLLVAHAGSSAGRGRSKIRTMVAAGLLLAALACLGVAMALSRPASRPMPLLAREDAGVAMYHFDRFDDLNLARSHFRRITTEAPNAPEGYAGLALVDAIDGFEAPARRRYCASGRSNLYRADAVGTSAMGRTAAAMLDITCDRSLWKARRELDAAIALDPSNSTALTLRARVAFWQNQPVDAVSFASKAVAADPTSPEALLTLALAYYYGGRFADARDTLQRLLELMPNRPAALVFLERSYEGLRDFVSAGAAVRAAQRDTRNASWVGATRARLLALTGRRSAALGVLVRVRASSEPSSLAAAYAALGDDGAAVAKLKQAALKNSLATQLTWLDDFRFAELRRRFRQLTPTFVTWF